MSPSPLGNWNTRREPRIGVMVHYDDSGSDAGAVAWLTQDPRCKVSYHWLVLDNGERVEIAPADARAWHAGVCRSSDPRLRYRDANSAFYGVALAMDGNDVVTEAARRSLVGLCATLFRTHGWDLVHEGWRIVGHSSEAWPRGRKIDPEGPDPAHPVLAVPALRAWVAAA